MEYANSYFRESRTRFWMLEEEVWGFKNEVLLFEEEVWWLEDEVLGLEEEV